MLDREVLLPEPLGRLAWSQLQRALDVFDLGTLEAVTPTSTGGFDYNQNVFLRTNLGEFVLKGAPRDPWQFPKEQFFAELISTRTPVRCPWPYHHHAQPDIFDWPFAIVPRLEGVELNTLQPAGERAPEDWGAIALAQAVALVELQSATFDRAGDFSLAVGGIEPYPGTYADWVVNEIAARLAQSPSISPDDARWIVELAQELNRGLGDQAPYVVVHGDFGYWNMLFDRVDRGYRVTGVYDLLTATIGNCLADVAFQYAKYVERDRDDADAFVHAYLTRSERSETSFDERIRLYIIYERLGLRDFAYRHAPQWIDWDVPFRAWISSFFPAGNR